MPEYRFMIVLGVDIGATLFAFVDNLGSRPGPGRGRGDVAEFASPANQLFSTI